MVRLASAGRWVVALVAVAVGASTFAIVFRASLSMFFRTAYGHPDVVSAMVAMPAGVRVLVAVMGGLLAGLFSRAAAKKGPGAGVGAGDRQQDRPRQGGVPGEVGQELVRHGTVAHPPALGPPPRDRGEQFGAGGAETDRPHRVCVIPHHDQQDHGLYSFEL